MSKKCSQNVIIWLCWAVYTFAYCGRYSYNANISLIMQDFNVTHAEAGLVTTCFFFAYGIGQVLNGFLCKRYNKKLIFPAVLFISSILNLLVFCKVPFGCIKYLWFLNGILQSCLWPSIVYVISTNLDAEHMERAILLMSTPAAIGTVIVYGASALFVSLGIYKVVFIFSICVMSLIGVLWLLFFAPSGVEIKKTEEKEEKKSESGVFGKFAFLFIVLAVFAIVDNFTKDGLNTWVPAILKEHFGVRDELSIILTLVLPILGTFGAVISLKLNSYIKDFILLATVMIMVSAVFIAIVTFVSGAGVITMIVCFGIVLCMMYGVNNVITSIAPLKMRDYVNSGKMAGVLNGFCYLGSTLSAYGLGKVVDNSNGNWQSAFYLLFGCCAFVIVLGIIYYIVNKSKMANR